MAATVGEAARKRARQARLAPSLRERAHVLSDSERLTNAERNIPLLYDFLHEEKLDWPSFSCCWGAARSAGNGETTQRLLFARATDARWDPLSRLYDGSPSLLEVVDVTIPAPRANALDLHSSKRSLTCSKVRIRPRAHLIHPDEPIRIKCATFSHELEIAVTHWQRPQLFVWNITAAVSDPDLSAYHDRGPGARTVAPDNSQADVPALELRGHEEVDLPDSTPRFFALDLSGPAERIASGGHDRRVCVWDLNKFVDTNESSKMQCYAEGVMQAYWVFLGHTKAVNAVAFNPEPHADTLLSAGDDNRVFLWDLRMQSKWAGKVVGLHGGLDINGLAWSPFRTHLVATGGGDGNIEILDLRRLSDTSFGAPIAELGPNNNSGAHGSEVPKCSIKRFGTGGKMLDLEWSAHDPRFLASSDEYCGVCVWNPDVSSPNPDLAPLLSGPAAWSSWNDDDGWPPELVFHHATHQSAPVCYSWSRHVPWLLTSFCSFDNGDVVHNSMQVWRPSELVFWDAHDFSAALSSASSSATSAPPAGPSADSQRTDTTATFLEDTLAREQESHAERKST